LDHSIGLIFRLLLMGEANMSRTLVMFAAVSGLTMSYALAQAPPATSFWPSGKIVAATARVAIGGVILGSNVWPSAPADVRSRLLLWSPDCNEQGQCG
jgi:hypothetical protein